MGNISGRVFAAIEKPKSQPAPEQTARSNPDTERPPGSLSGHTAGPALMCLFPSLRADGSVRLWLRSFSTSGPALPGCIGIGRLCLLLCKAFSKLWRTFSVTHSVTTIFKCAKAPISSNSGVFLF